MKKILFLFQCIAFLIFSAYSQNFEHAFNFNSIGSNIGYAIDHDLDGNAYVTGHFGRTIDFDPGLGVADLSTSLIFGTDMFIAKYDSEGNYVWAISLPATGHNQGLSISTDGSGVYVTGSFLGTMDMDPGPGTANLVVGGGQDAFVIKYDAITGAYVWGFSLSSTFDNWGNGIYVKNGKVYITGKIQNTVDFDPGVPVVNLAPIGSEAMFVAKYDSNGTYEWAKALSPTSSAVGFSIIVDNSENVTATGYYLGTLGGLTSGGGTGTNSDILLVQFDSLGVQNWIWGFGEATPGGGGAGISLATDGSNIYVTGNYLGTIDMDPSGTVSNIGVSSPNYMYTDAFVAKYNSSGSHIWSYGFGGDFIERSTGITLDDSALYIIGDHESACDLDPGIPTVPFVTAEGHIIKYDLDGNYEWHIELTGDVAPRGIDFDYDHKIGVIGTFSGTVDFDPINTYNLVGGDIFFAKYSNRPCSDTLIITNTEICQGDSILILGIYRSVADTFYDTLLSYQGCDSITEIILTVNPLPTVNFSTIDSICDTSGLVSLAGTPIGGIFTGVGVTGNNFDPQVAGLGTHIITYSYSDGNGCQNSDMDSIKVIFCPILVGIGGQEFIPDQIKVYPNPSASLTTIKFTGGSGELYNCLIYNSISQLVYSVYDISIDEIEINGLQSGLYYFQIIDNSSKIFQGKFTIR